MIQSIKHKALRNYWTNGQTKGLDAKLVAKLRRILLALDDASAPEDMNIPSWKFHMLSGDRTGTYSIRLTGNWRVTFQWNGKDATFIDIEDYH